MTYHCGEEEHESVGDQEDNICRRSPLLGWCADEHDPCSIGERDNVSDEEQNFQRERNDIEGAGAGAHEALMSGEEAATSRVHVSSVRTLLGRQLTPMASNDTDMAREQERQAGKAADERGLVVYKAGRARNRRLPGEVRALRGTGGQTLLGPPLAVNKT